MKAFLLLICLTFTCAGLSAQAGSKQHAATKQAIAQKLDLQPKQKRAVAKLHKEVSAKLAELKEAGKLFAHSPELAALREYELQALATILTKEQFAKLNGLPVAKE